MIIKLDRTCLLVAVVIFVGYLFIFISVVSAPSYERSSVVGVAGAGGGEGCKVQMQQMLLVERGRCEEEKKIVAADAAKEALKLFTAEAAHQPPPPPEKTKGEEEATTHSLMPAVRPGVIVLGMHRSGTSIIGGLVNKMGLKTGGPLIQAAEDNAKGFFERIDVVLQNDYLMKKQHVHYAYDTQRYDAKLGLTHVLTDTDGSLFKEGAKGLAFLNDVNSYPWMLKDPRLCITLRTWLPLLKFVPAILFTYRHPLDVALSLNKREFEQFKIARGLKMWYVYNMRAILQSHDLCRVVASHRNVMKTPDAEMARIRKQLLECGVPVPRALSASDVADFVDVKLQHGRTTLADTSCERDLATLVPPETWQTSETEHLILYREVMRVYCAMESGEAFHPDFAWKEDMKDT